jgi:hypothetical protein
MTRRFSAILKRVRIFEKERRDRILLLSFCAFLIASPLLIAAFSLIHAWRDHADCEASEPCPICAQMAPAQNVFRQLGDAHKCAIFFFCAVYAAICGIKPVRRRTNFKTLIALKIQLNS